MHSFEPCRLSENEMLCKERIIVAHTITINTCLIIRAFINSYSSVRVPCPVRPCTGVAIVHTVAASPIALTETAATRTEIVTALSKSRVDSTLSDDQYRVVSNFFGDIVSFSFNCLERGLASLSRPEQCFPPPVFSSTTWAWSAVPSSISANIVQSAYWHIITPPHNSCFATFSFLASTCI